MEFRPWAHTTVLEGHVTKLTVSVASARVAGRDDSEGELVDVFVEQVDVLTSVLGEASERSPGEVRSVTWTLENGSTVSLAGKSSRYSCDVTSPAFTEEAARRLRPQP